MAFDRLRIREANRNEDTSEAVDGPRIGRHGIFASGGTADVPNVSRHQDDFAVNICSVSGTTPRRHRVRVRKHHDALSKPCITSGEQATQTIILTFSSRPDR